MRRSVAITALIAASVVGCSGSDGDTDTPGTDDDAPEPAELQIDGPAQVDDDDGAVLAD